MTTSPYLETPTPSASNAGCTRFIVTMPHFWAMDDLRDETRTGRESFDSGMALKRRVSHSFRFSLFEPPRLRAPHPFLLLERVGTTIPKFRCLPPFENREKWGRISSIIPNRFCHKQE